MVITANFLAVALGGIFYQSSQSNIMVAHPFSTSINTDIQNVILMDGVQVETFAKDTEGYWLAINSSVVESSNFQAWATDEFSFLPFDRGTGDVLDFVTSITQGYGGSLECRLLAGNTFQQISKMDGGVGYAPTLGVNVTIPISDGNSVHCWNNKTMDVLSLKPGIHPFAVEWVWGPQSLRWQ